MYYLIRANRYLVRLFVDYLAIVVLSNYYLLASTTSIDRLNLKYIRDIAYLSNFNIAYFYKLGPLIIPADRISRLISRRAVAAANKELVETTTDVDPIGFAAVA